MKTRPGKLNLNQIAELFYENVTLKRQKHLKDKGHTWEKPLSTWYINNEYQNAYINSVYSVFEEAEARLGVTRPVASTQKRMQIYREVYRLLEAGNQDIRFLLQTPREGGRPPKRKGYIASVIRKPSKKRGRRKGVKPDDEKAWMHLVLGMASCLWAEKKFPRLSREAEIIEKLTSQPYWLHKLKSERFIANALQLPEMKQHNPPSLTPEALRKRFYRALEKYPLPAALKNT